MSIQPLLAAAVTRHRAGKLCKAEKPESWKIRHATTEMRRHVWMQNEEAALLDQPATVFHAQHDVAIRLIRERIGLDLFGLDCAVDRAGNVLVSEANGSMPVRDDAAFPYKSPHVARIKGAFDALLAARSRRWSVCHTFS